MFALLAALMLAAAPPPGDGPTLCVCTTASKKAEIIFRGVAVDAVLTASPDGASVNPRQATIFRVGNVIQGEAPTPMKVWHTTNPQKCGVKFGYAQTYVVRARKKNGVVETDSCLMPSLGSKPPK